MSDFSRMKGAKPAIICSIYHLIQKLCKIIPALEGLIEMMPAKLAVSYAGNTKILQKYNFILIERFAIRHTPIHSLNQFTLSQSFCQLKQVPVMI